MSDVKTVVSVTERSTKAVTAAAGNLAKVVLELQGLAEGSEQISQEIQFKQKELSQIETQYDEKLAEAKSTLKIKTLENEDSVVNAILKARGLTSIDANALKVLETDLAVALDSKEDDIRSAVSSAVATAEARAAQELGVVEANHRVALAEITANSNAKDQKINFLEDQVTDLRGQVDAERDTRLKIAQAESGRQGVVVNAGK